MSTTIQRDGRTWNVDNEGINNLKRTYTFVLDTNNLSANGELTTFTGVPAIGSAHPTYSYLSVQSYDVAEGQNAEKKLVNVTVNYSRKYEGQDETISGDVLGYVEEWGWDVGTNTIEVTNNLLTSQGNFGGTLLNSAGDPFENVPTCESPAPSFTKVIKTTTRKNWLQYNCKINSNTCTIGSMTCGPKTLLASVSEKRIFDDDKYRYRYTITLRYKSHPSLFGSGTTAIEFGWDIPIVDAGMRQFDDSNPPKLKIIMQVDEETNQPCKVTSAELLDGSGHKAIRDPNTNRAQPYIIRVQAYEKTSFPLDLYSEPA